MINENDVKFYQDQGYLVVEDVVTGTELEALRSDLAHLVSEAASVTENNETYDLEDSHSSEDPRVRRIKEPHKVMPSVDALMRQVTMLK